MSGCDPSKARGLGFFALLYIGSCVAKAHNLEVNGFLNTRIGKIWGTQMVKLCFFLEVLGHSTLMSFVCLVSTLKV
jgi:hypothetical protein